MNLRTREQLRELNAQDWADFKSHWPMRVIELVLDIGAGTLLGVLLGLALLLAALEGAV